MEEEILTNMEEEDDIEMEMKSIEKEEAEEEIKKSTIAETKKEPIEKASETYEAFAYSPRLTIANTITGETMEFKPDRDEGMVQLGVLLLNKLDKIEIAQGV